MKTKGMITAIALVCGLAATGCSDDTMSTLEKNLKNLNSSVSESSSSSDDNSSSETDKSSDKSDSSQSEDKADEDVSEKSGIEAAKAEARPEEQTRDQSDNDDENAPMVAESFSESDKSDLDQTASELYKACCETTWNMLVNIGYELDYSDMNGDAPRVVGYDSIAQLESEYAQYFTDVSSDISSKYFEADGKLYCHDTGRGADIYYKSTELMLESADSENAVFTAVSYYADPDTGEPMDKKVHTFKMTLTDNGWKASDFTLPY